jgi:hypothetical protein
MNFFEILFWMGMLCLFPVLAVVVRDAFSAIPSLSRFLPYASPPQSAVDPKA